MLRATFLSAVLLSTVYAVDFRNSVVVTSADVAQNQPYTPSLIAGQTYRVYAVYASTGSQAYAKNVLISDDVGALNVAGLSKPAVQDNTGYVLDDYRILRAPITINDQNTAGTTRTPFTIYIVSAAVPRFTVVSAQLASGQVDSNYGFLAAGITVLSAEQYFTLYSFDIGNMASMLVSTVGFDVTDTSYNVLSLNSQNEARLSFLSVYGPISTIFNANYGLNARFRFQISKNTKYDVGMISPGAKFAFLSPGYLSQTQSYNIPYTITDALDRSYQFGSIAALDVYSDVRDFQAGESVLVRVVDQTNTPRDTNFGQQTILRQQFLASSISMSVSHPNNPSHTPRFLFQIGSSATLNFSLMGILLVALFSKMH